MSAPSLFEMLGTTNPATQQYHIPEDIPCHVNIPTCAHMPTHTNTHAHELGLCSWCSD